VSRPILITTLAVALVLSACSGSEAEPTTTSAAPTTSPTTTSTSSTTTTEPPPTTLTLESDLPEGMVREAELLYSHLIDQANPAPARAPDTLVRHLVQAGVTRTAGTASAEGSMAELSNGDRVGVITTGDDALVMMDDGSGWTIVGAIVDGARPWLGQPRQRRLVVLGSDARVGEDQLMLRADSVHLLTMRSRTGEGAFLGFPRDSWVRGSKLTNIMPIGGPDLMVEVITEVSGIQPEGWVAVGFEGFLGLMEELGSLEIDLPTEMRSGNNWDDYPAGSQVLTPQLALRLARIRKGLPAGDFDRSYNQGLIVEAAMTMLQTIGIEELPRWVKAFDTHGFTNLDTEALTTFAALTYVTSPEKLTNLVVPGVNGTVGAAAVVFISDSAEAVFRDLDDGAIDTPPEG
jgi:LCP family protein required for cell wall assembly